MVIWAVELLEEDKLETKEEVARDGPPASADKILSSHYFITIQRTAVLA